MVLTKEIVKAARALLNWTQHDLASRAGIAMGTLARFEASTGMHDDTATKLILAMQQGGIDLIIDDGMIVGLKKRKKTKET